MITPSLKTFFVQYRKRIEQLLQNALPQRVPGGERLHQAMAYSLLGEGKRIRPILSYAAAHVGNNSNTPLVDATACALECIHAYSLIHDDLPSMDDDDLRRGLPTCHIAFDEATAILAGDALQCLAFEILANAKGSARTIIALTRELGRASGATGMVAGQAIDLAAIDKTPPLNELELMHNHKTGALIEAAVIMGALASGIQAEAQLVQMRHYAKAVGLSFQVQDDILDVTSATETLGKRQGADQLRNKPTYVSLLGLEGAKDKAQTLYYLAIESLSGFGSEADILRGIASYIINRTR